HAGGHARRTAPRPRHGTHTAQDSRPGTGPHDATQDGAATHPRPSQTRSREPLSGRGGESEGSPRPTGVPEAGRAAVPGAVRPGTLTCPRRISTVSQRWEAPWWQSAEQQIRKVASTSKYEARS